MTSPQNVTLYQVWLQEKSGAGFTKKHQKNNDDVNQHCLQRTGLYAYRSIMMPVPAGRCAVFSGKQHAEVTLTAESACKAYFGHRQISGFQHGGGLFQTVVVEHLDWFPAYGLLKTSETFAAAYIRRSGDIQNRQVLCIVVLYECQHHTCTFSDR